MKMEKFQNSSFAGGLDKLKIAKRQYCLVYEGSNAAFENNFSNVLIVLKHCGNLLDLYKDFNAVFFRNLEGIVL